MGKNSRILFSKKIILEPNRNTWVERVPLYASKYIDIPMYQQYADPKLTGFFRENLSILGPHTVQMYSWGIKGFDTP